MYSNTVYVTAHLLLYLLCSVWALVWLQRARRYPVPSPRPKNTQQSRFSPSSRIFGQRRMQGSAAAEPAATDLLDCPGHVNFDDDSMLRLKQEELDRLRASFDEYVATSGEVEAELQLALEISEGKLHAATRLQQQAQEQVEDLQQRVLVAERRMQEERDRRQDTAALEGALGTDCARAIPLRFRFSAE